jgi:hypothetical protein
MLPLSGAPQSGVPGIYIDRPRVMDSGLATFGAPRNNQPAHMIDFMESRHWYGRLRSFTAP